MKNPSQIYGASPAVWDYTVLPATRHKWTRPALTPAQTARMRVLDFPTTQEWKAELTLALVIYYGVGVVTPPVAILQRHKVASFRKKR